MRWDLAEICLADGIILLPGWEKSEGALKEKQVAEWTGRDIKYAVHIYGVGWTFLRGGAFYEVPDPTVAHMRGVDGPGAWERHPGDVGPHSDVPTFYEKVLANHAAEVRVVDPATGGEKGQKDVRTDLLPADVLRAGPSLWAR